MGRVAYHFNFEVPNLDVYTTFKLGAAIGFFMGGPDDLKGGGGVAVGFNVGARYFVTPTIAPFAELGFDRYNFNAKYKSGGRSVSYSYHMSTWFTLGVTFRL